MITMLPLALLEVRFSWPALVVGAILLIYWVRVMQMVGKARKTAGHDANFIPPELLGRLLRIIWIPTVALWVFLPLIFAFVVFDFAPFRPFYFPFAYAIQSLAAFVAIGAFVITWICWQNMGKSWRMGINPGEKTELVFSGPFAYVRNPIYGLSQLLMLCAIIVAPMPIMLVIGLIHVLFMQWEVRREEKNLLAVHGDAYRAYMTNVSRFVPTSLKPYRNTSGNS